MPCVAYHWPGDAALSKARTGFSIGGVAPGGYAVMSSLIDRSLMRFDDEVWAAQNAIRFSKCRKRLEWLLGAPLVDNGCGYRG
jgi:hypothetical protein